MAGSGPPGSTIIPALSALVPVQALSSCNGRHWPPRSARCWVTARPLDRPQEAARENSTARPRPPIGAGRGEQSLHRFGAGPCSSPASCRRSAPSSRSLPGRTHGAVRLTREHPGDPGWAPAHVLPGVLACRRCTNVRGCPTTSISASTSGSSPWSRRDHCRRGDLGPPSPAELDVVAATAKPPAWQRRSIR